MFTENQLDGVAPPLPNNKNIVCQLCDKSSHTAKTYRKGLKALVAIKDRDVVSENNWLLDSCAFKHMTPDVESLSNVQNYSGTSR